MLFLGEKFLNIHESWNGFIYEQSAKLKLIEDQIQESKYTPEADKILRFLEVDLNSVKVIILGQDPYPQQGVATGRSFEVGTLKSWIDKFSNVSLKNIIRAIYKAEKSEIVKYSDLIKTKLNQNFNILPPTKLFSYWETQGVLLLNTSYTCEIGKPGSHAKIWFPFTQELLQFIAKENSNIIWFLWGDHAKKAVEKVDIKEHHKIESFHPMMCYDRENDFLYAVPNCFEKTWNLIDWTGYRNQKIEQAEQKGLF